MRIALGIEYKGTRFHGWQDQQDGLPTVQASLEQAVSKVANETIKLICAGRTDAGVHASAQVVHFDTNVERSKHAWVLGTKSYLPSDITVGWAQPVSSDFHARFSALRRAYRYIIYNHMTAPALIADQVTWVPQKLDVKQMAIAAKALVGRHDFSSFRATGCQAKSPVREVYSLSVERKQNMIMIDIEANAFLHHMVRNIVGTLIAVGKARQPATWLAEVLAAKDRRQAGMMSGAGGLYLAKVVYPEEFAIPQTEWPMLI